MTEPAGDNISRSDEYYNQLALKVNEKCSKKPKAVIKKKSQPKNKQFTIEQMFQKKNVVTDPEINDYRQLFEDLSKLIKPPTFSEDFGYKSFLKSDPLFEKCWYYPLHNDLRKYQFQLAQTALYNNTLVCLPTGLGKTWIAAIVILNYYLWYPDGKIFFLAPTKPLVAQQIQCLEVFQDIIPSDIITCLCGTVTNRQEVYKTNQIFFMTPQTLENDLKKNKLDPKTISLVIFDEAHKATGDYSYTQIIKILNKSSFGYRILGLSATPGNNMEKVQEVVTNLCISKIEYKDEIDEDVKIYIKKKKIITEVIKNTQQIEDLLSQLQPVLKQISDKVIRFRIVPVSMLRFLSNPQTLNPGIIFKLREDLKEDSFNIETQIGRGQIFHELKRINLVYAKKILLEQGIGCYINYLINFQSTNQTSNLKKQLIEDPQFKKLINYVQTMDAQNAKQHPKLSRLSEILDDFFKNELTKKSKAIVFTNSRSSAQEITQFLISFNLIKPSIFIGQQSKKGGVEGMNQKMQVDVMKKFKQNKFNVLVATCIAEEGLDIGEVDLIICYDSGFSPIRMVQRMGRTGRKRDGKIIVLLTQGKEVRDYERFLKEGKKIKTQIRSNSLNLTLKTISNQQPSKKQVVKQPIVLNFFSFNPKMINNDQKLNFFKSNCDCGEFKSLSDRPTKRLNLQQENQTNVNDDQEETTNFIKKQTKFKNKKHPNKPEVFYQTFQQEQKVSPKIEINLHQNEEDDYTILFRQGDQLGQQLEKETIDKGLEINKDSDQQYQREHFQDEVEQIQEDDNKEDSNAEYVNDEDQQEQNENEDEEEQQDMQIDLTSEFDQMEESGLNPEKVFQSLDDDDESEDQDQNEEEIGYQDQIEDEDDEEYRQEEVERELLEQLTILDQLDQSIDFDLLKNIVQGVDDTNDQFQLGSNDDLDYDLLSQFAESHHQNNQVNPSNMRFQKQII